MNGFVNFRRLFRKSRNKVFPMSPAALGRDRIVKIPRFETYLANGCNLTCYLCSHFCPMRKGVTPISDVMQWFETWRQKIEPRAIGLLGGEPLLQQEFHRTVYKARECWPKAKIELVTNGVLLGKIKNEGWDALKNVGVHVVVSRHTQDHVINQKIDDGVKLIKARKISCEVRPSISQWVAYHQLGPDNQPMPFQSDPEKAWNTCIPKIQCVALWDNHLYKCSILANVIQSRKEGIVGEAWDAACSYVPLGPESTPEEISDHLSEKAVPQCRICPEHYQTIDIEKLEENGLKLKNRSRENVETPP